MRPTVIGFAALLTLSVPSLGRAALYAADLVARSGDGLLTVDTASGLEWLDVTATVGQTYDAVASGPYVGSLGFRFATGAEVEALWRDAGAEGTFTNDTGSNIDAANYGAAILLIDLMGCTSQLVGEACDGVSQNWNIAMYGPGSPDPHLVSAAIVDAYGPPDIDAGRAAMWLDFGPTVDLPSRPDVGSYLVRAVPESNAPAMLALGVLVLASVGRRKLH